MFMDLLDTHNMASDRLLLFRENDIEISLGQRIECC